MNDYNDRPMRRPGNSRLWVALVFILGGGALLLQRMGFPVPYWVFSWQCLLIVIGICMGFSHGFRGGGWLILILIGGFFMIHDWIPDFSLHQYLWPLAIIVVGLVLLLRPRYHGNWRNWDSRRSHDFSSKGQAMADPLKSTESKPGAEDFFESTSIFGGAKKIILSKNFQGGSITCVMGGCEIDLTQADFEKVAVIDISQTFGGTKLIVPPHWQVRIEMSSVFGGVEDKRKPPVAGTSDKLLIIKGSSVFGGIEIKNY
jgi:predicted membrane protein